MRRQIREERTRSAVEATSPTVCTNRQRGKNAYITEINVNELEMRGRRKQSVVAVTGARRGVSGVQVL